MWRDVWVGVCAERVAGLHSGGRVWSTSKLHRPLAVEKEHAIGAHDDALGDSRNDQASGFKTHKQVWHGSL